MRCHLRHVRLRAMQAASGLSTEGAFNSNEWHNWVSHCAGQASSINAIPAEAGIQCPVAFEIGYLLTCDWIPSQARNDVFMVASGPADS
jgi:hypothetical protein